MLYIDLRRSLPSLHSSLSPASALAPNTPDTQADRPAQLEAAQEAARGMRRLFLATLLFWAALLGWYLYV